MLHSEMTLLCTGPWPDRSERKQTKSKMSTVYIGTSACSGHPPLRSRARTMHLHAVLGWYCFVASLSGPFSCLLPPRSQGNPCSAPSIYFYFSRATTKCLLFQLNIYLSQMLFSGGRVSSKAALAARKRCVMSLIQHGKFNLSISKSNLTS